ncbi:hypothetical protein LDENG_00231650, partial [Lucifuga dentata]
PWAWGCLLRFCGGQGSGGVLRGVAWPALLVVCLSASVVHVVPFLAPGLVCCPSSPLSPWGSASWVSSRLGCPAWPCGFYRAWRSPRIMVRFCV